jgi:uncharacterized protein YbjT (DUF2867 family)
MSDTSAVLLGSSGLVGGFCLRTLVSDARYRQITLLNRRNLKLASASRVVEKLVNFEGLSSGDFAGADDIFCALGTTIRKAGSQAAFRRIDLEYPLAAAKTAFEAGARQFVLVSSVGANATAKNSYLRTKGELEQELSKLGFSSVHILRPSLLLGEREEFRLGERIAMVVMPPLNFAMVGSMRRYRAISAATVGQAMVAAARSGRTGTIVYEHDEIQALASR